MIYCVFFNSGCNAAAPQMVIFFLFIQKNLNCWEITLQIQLHDGGGYVTDMRSLYCYVIKRGSKFLKQARRSREGWRCSPPPDFCQI